MGKRPCAGPNAKVTSDRGGAAAAVLQKESDSGNRERCYTRHCNVYIISVIALWRLKETESARVVT